MVGLGDMYISKLNFGSDECLAKVICSETAIARDSAKFTCICSTPKVREGWVEDLQCKKKRLKVYLDCRFLTWESWKRVN